MINDSPLWLRKESRMLKVKNRHYFYSPRPDQNNMRIFDNIRKYIYDKFLDKTYDPPPPALEQGVLGIIFK